jgi:hypothetical protein
MYTILKVTYAFHLNGCPNNHVYAYAFQRRPCLLLLLTRARAPALCVMGGRQRLLGDAYLPTRTRAAALRVMVYRLAGPGGSTNKLTAQGSLY